MKKVISPKMHGMIDYALSSALMMLPAKLGVNKKASSNYCKLAMAVSGMNAMTDAPAGIKKVVPMKVHQKADMAVLGALALTTMSKTVRKDRATLIFHLSLLGMLGLHYALTDYDAA